LTRVAFVTYSGLPALNADDRLAVVALDGMGVATDAVCWDDKTVEWTAYDAIVLRSTWDYFKRVDEFGAWIDRLDAAGAKLWNPPATLRWNIDKTYLRDLRHPNLAPPPGVFFVRHARIDVAALLEARGWTEAVIKPTISADGFSTERVSRATADEDQATADAMVERVDVMIQRLVPEVRTNGELSLMFFDGVFSHAVGKRPASGEFRVQERLGGVISPATAPVRLIRHATELVASAAPLSLYARVDIVVAEDRFVLMELELTEPSLFLAHAPGAAQAFAAAVFSRACHPPVR
jgi:glutathione synthase/RimK-type ligase-like ATP-grasp enzyme